MSLQNRFDTAIGNMALLSCGNSFSSLFHVMLLPHLPVSAEFGTKSISALHAFLTGKKIISEVSQFLNNKNYFTWSWFGV